MPGHGVGEYEKEEEDKKQTQMRKKGEGEQANHFGMLTREDIVPRSPQMWRKFAEEMEKVEKEKAKNDAENKEPKQSNSKDAVGS